MELYSPLYRTLLLTRAWCWPGSNVVHYIRNRVPLGTDFGDYSKPVDMKKFWLKQTVKQTVKNKLTWHLSPLKPMNTWKRRSAREGKEDRGERMEKVNNSKINNIIKPNNTILHTYIGITIRNEKHMYTTLMLRVRVWYPAIQNNSVSIQTWHRLQETSVNQI
jgi:hypothetical protein